MDPIISARLRDLPSVAAVLNTSAAAVLVERYGQQALTDAVRATIEDARAALQEGRVSVPTAEHIALESRTRLERQDRSGSRPVFNLTGTVLHTNLGRAVLSEAAVEAAMAAMQNPVALEFDLKGGKRGERDDHVRGLLCDLTGAEDATVVNNNAAAMLLVLNTLANGREAIVSRGELIEIGGAFRMPEIMASAGARLVEVGTTNRTHMKDYRSALNERTGLILKVHTSNYRIQGFTAEVGTADLSAIARRAGVPLAHDLGSGTLVDLAQYGLQAEPTVWQAAAAADVVTFSGDKLLGGPQAGFIVGKRDLIQAINRNPMKRALRIDKIRLAAIEATLKLYRDPVRLAERLPTLQMLTRPRDEIQAQAQRVLPHVTEALGGDYAVELCECRSQIGSGALPLETIASAGLAIAAKRKGSELERLSAMLRQLPRPVIGRIVKERLVLDLRCLGEEEAFLCNLAHFNVIAQGRRRRGPSGERAATGAPP
ncbi:MAG: L-seryl-tRNA(Sec) selenium transferase [Roseiarcus sp.]